VTAANPLAIGVLHFTSAGLGDTLSHLHAAPQIAGGITLIRRVAALALYAVLFVSPLLAAKDVRAGSGATSETSDREPEVFLCSHPPVYYRTDMLSLEEWYAPYWMRHKLDPPEQDWIIGFRSFCNDYKMLSGWIPGQQPKSPYSGLLLLRRPEFHCTYTPRSPAPGGYVREIWPFQIPRLWLIILLDGEYTPQIRRSKRAAITEWIDLVFKNRVATDATAFIEPICRP
jgi:hypothetical protein